GYLPTNMGWLNVKINLAYWSKDGAISPVDAICHSAEILVEQLSPFI
ncbi:unnamed protein product, partial [marine sediment metagenome]